MAYPSVLKIAARGVAAACVLTVFMAAGGCSRQATLKIELNEDKDIIVRKGQVLEIAIESNPTTGYLWSLEGFSGAETLTSTGKYQYVRGADRIGAGGKQIFSFIAEKKGSAKLIFEYRRGWEKEISPAKRYTARVTVK
jgi:predicted secreted protein